VRITVRNCCRVVFEERNVAKEGVNSGTMIIFS